MFVNDLFKLIENSNEEYYAVYNQRGRPMIMRKPVGKTAEAYAEEKNLIIKGGPFGSHQETESFWIRRVLPAKKDQGVKEGNLSDILNVPGKVLRTARDVARGMPTGTSPDSQDGTADGDLVNTATKIGKQVIDATTDAARGMPTGTSPKQDKDKEVKEQGVAEGGFDIPEIPRAPQPRPEPKNKTVGEGSVQDKLHRRHQELRKKRGAPDPEYYRELKATFDLPDEERYKKAIELKKKYQVKESSDGSIKYEFTLANGKKDYQISKPTKPGDKAPIDIIGAKTIYKANNPLQKIKSVKVVDKPKEEESKVKNEDRERYLDEMRLAGYEIVTEAATLCPECGGVAYANQILAEKQDACYHKVKSRYKVWPSAYASGALVRCRKKGAKNWGNKSKK